MIEVAQATVTIIPTMRGSQQTITKDLSAETEPAAAKAGQSSGKKFTSSMGGAIKSGAKVLAAAVTASIASVTALGTSFFNAAKATAEFGDNIDKASQKLGISSDAYQEWDFICQHSGTSMDAMKTNMTKLSQAATKGSDAFEKLGFSAEEAQNMSREELWDRTVKGLTGVSDETERARIAQELFGKGATEMGALLNTSAEDIEAMRQQAHDLGIVMSEDDVKAAAAFQDSLQNLTQTFQGLKNKLMAEFMPGITDVMDGLTLIFSGDEEGGVAKIKEGIESISTKITEVLPTLVETGGQILTAIMGAITENLPLLVPLAADLLVSLGEAIITSLPTIMDAGVDILMALINAIIENGPELMAKGAVLLTNLVTSISEKLPEILALAGELIVTLVNGLIENAPQIVTGAIEGIKAFISGITEHLPEILAGGAEIIGTLLSGIVENAPALLESIGGTMGDIITAISGAIATILEALEPYAPFITEIVTTTVDKLPEIITAFTGLAETIGGIITTIVEAIAPYIPDITSMVTTTVEKLPEIIAAFSDLFEKIGPIIESIGGVIATIGTALSEVVTSLGTSVAGIVDSFSGLSSSLAEPITAIGSLIESIGTAIGTVIESIGTAVASINESFAKVLDSLKGVIDSIGEGAVKAGDGFSKLADAIIKLVNQTGFFDLAATLTAVATAVGSIADTGKKAGDAYKNLEKLITTLSSLAATDFGTMAADLELVANKLYVITIYTPTLKDTKTNLDALGKVNLSGLVKGLGDVDTKLTELDKTISSKMKSMTSTITTESGSWAGKIKEAVNSVKNILKNVSWSIPELKIPVKRPKFSVEGKWEYDKEGNVTKVPKINVEWYRRAATMGALFDSPTIIGVGDAAQPELLIGEDTLFNAIRQAVGDGGYNQTINITAPQGLDPAETARLIRNNSRQMIARMRGGV